MRLALGLCVHTGWAAAAVAGGDWEKPLILVRERWELLGPNERLVFHKAAEMAMDKAEDWVARERREATERAKGELARLAAAHGVNACAVVAKKGAMLPLAEIVAAHPRIHTAEGCFYRDVLKDAAEQAGWKVTVVAPKELDAKDARLAEVGKVVGKPWSVDWKMAVMGAWLVSLHHAE